MRAYSFSREDIKNRCDEALKNPATFYSKSFIKTEDGLKDEHSIYRTEVIAKYVCDNFKEFESIKNSNPRKGSYDMEHTGEHENTGDRPEDELAIELFNICKHERKEFDYIGKVIDYQTPLKNGRNPAVDLLSVRDNILYILELKYCNSGESLLRCVLEAYTYKKLVNESKLIKDFQKKLNGRVQNVVAAPLISIRSDNAKSPYKDLREMIFENKKPELKTMMGLMGITTVFTYDNVDGEYRFGEVIV